jgi:hypothetical protein
MRRRRPSGVCREPGGVRRVGRDHGLRRRHVRGRSVRRYVHPGVRSRADPLRSRRGGRDLRPRAGLPAIRPRGAVQRGRPVRGRRGVRRLRARADGGPGVRELWPAGPNLRRGGPPLGRLRGLRGRGGLYARLRAGVRALRGAAVRRRLHVGPLRGRRGLRPRHPRSLRQLRQPRVQRRVPVGCVRRRRGLRPWRAPRLQRLWRAGMHRAVPMGAVQQRRRHRVPPVQRVRLAVLLPERQLV